MHAADTRAGDERTTTSSIVLQVAGTAVVIPHQYALPAHTLTFAQEFVSQRGTSTGRKKALARSSLGTSQQQDVSVRVCCAPKTFTVRRPLHLRHLRPGRISISNINEAAKPTGGALQMCLCTAMFGPTSVLALPKSAVACSHSNWITRNVASRCCWSDR